ncbi:Protein of unknown function DUF2513 [uncultured Caudovirales phage]|uniref:DUF2513 domain-containing protein n=1 Tax=uncultured Caudovirales phage TaxID=2100421 RepID=A0A6J5NM47_9CAUD|nr:Protein of unknown function DUF2513 [uncultured Caudovirales phage]
MKRDLDLCRAIMLRMEAHDHGFAPRDMTFDGYSDEAVGYHCLLLVQARLIEGTKDDGDTSESPTAIPTAITWLGHEFLSAAKDDTVWEKAKKHVIAPGAAVSFAVLLEWLKAEGLRRLGL